ncbi:hypothetical protein A2011_03835 [candidate division CPR3 bacterium GWE2_35_7]|uniref:Uncharacterized protein n=1 Tax=candidate division CPR3 bacterium GW2011_GWF2_35_18 TaxID=1618350 RepID=A0A0G0C0V6_UNCC3|nr:MAG: hypothetical protein UR67_C0003G0029 [candidate division CPR3 bacterium GW2011_GWF2_35_18]KKP86696.1 MAG: hypothetical protein UR87_C0013G0013 [candidate division CPR3 bacterium GW2011_GWE2_35_7]OGB80457.1 MAG: hypothetical protein A2011_03835 [candidate division CPR3 bacterium GWE2_35_7]
MFTPAEEAGQVRGGPMNTKPKTILLTKAQEILGMHGLRTSGIKGNFLPVYTEHGQVVFQLFCGTPAADDYIGIHDFTMMVFNQVVREAFDVVRKTGYTTRIAVFTNESGRNDFRLEIVLWSDETGSAILYLALKDEHYSNPADIEKFFGQIITLHLPINQAISICHTLEAATDGEAEGCLDGKQGLTRKAYDTILNSLNAKGLGWQNPFENT